MPIHVQHAIRAKAPAQVNDVFNAVAIRQAPRPALLSRLRDRLAATKAMAIGLVLASLATALPAQAGPAESAIAVARGCPVGMICVYASKAVFDNPSTTSPLSQVAYNASGSTTVDLKKAGAIAAGTVRVVSLPGMIGKNPARYIFNNSSQQISYITNVFPSPTVNVTRVHPVYNGGNAYAKSIVIGTKTLGLCRLYKDNGQFVNAQDGQSLPLGSKEGYSITQHLLYTLAQQAQHKETIDNGFFEPTIKYSGNVDFDQFATSVNDVLDAIPGSIKTTAAEIIAALERDSSGDRIGQLDEAYRAFNAAVAVILKKNKGTKVVYPDQNDLEAPQFPAGKITFPVPDAGPSFAGILVAYSSTTINRDGVFADVGTSYTALCKTLVQNRAASN